ncbi:MAG TPA: hypothetical protein VFU32_13775 [Ktedonobacterales bacterium]|nr:hypothetical protein [Ktedonobacterales bacterium]
MSASTPAEPEPNPAHHKRETPETLEELAAGGSSAPAAIVKHPAPPMKRLEKHGDEGSERLHKDVDLLTPLFLEVLDDIERAGLTAHYDLPVRQSMRAYMTIMDGAWEALGEERLSAVVNETGYQLEIAKLHQWLLERKKRCAEAIAALQAKGEAAPEPSFSWQRRAKLYRQALQAWEQSLDRQGDAHISGQGLFRMHGFYGISSLNWFELSVLSVLRWATMGVIVLVFLAYLVSNLFTVVFYNVSALATLAVLLFLALVGFYIVRLNFGSSAPIQVILGYAMAPRQQVTFTAEGISVVPTAARRRRMRQFLELWSAIVLGASPFIAIGALAGLSVVQGIISTNEGWSGMAVTISGSVSLLLVLVLPLSYLFFLPFVLYTQALLSRDLAIHPDWGTSARRYALRFSLILLPYEIAGGLAISIALRQWLNLDSYAPILTIGSAPLRATTLLYLLAFIVPYLIFIDLPYRYGVDHWKLKHLRELRSARRLAEEEIARLPLRGEEKEDLHELEYHLGWIEYYRGAMEEVADTSESPFPVERRTTAFLLATPLPLIFAALQDIQGGTISSDVFDLIRALLGGKAG